MVKRAFERKGTYYYFFPTYAQGEKILWNGMDRNGFKFTDHVPQGIRKRTDNSAMLIELINGSILQVIGTDKIDSIVGTNPIGCVFSEFPLQNPNAWGFIRPILAENGGWAVFEYTPRGKMNHGYDLYTMAKDSPDRWFCEVLTADDTKIISQEVLDQEREEIIQQYGDDSLFQQEYFCSFDASIQGAYYNAQLKLAEKEGRITNVSHEAGLPVDTWWDLGIGDAMCIWFTQNVGKEIHVIDYYEGQGEGFPFYAQILQNKGYVYGAHHAPHDIEARELGSGKSRKETAMKLGILFQTVKNLSIDDGINAARMIFPKCWFDAKKCKQGLNALSNYHKEYDEKRHEYKNQPYHDWSSHGADAFRYFAVGHRASPYSGKDVIRREKRKQNSGYAMRMA